MVKSLKVIAANLLGVFLLLAGLELLIRTAHPTLRPIGTEQSLITDGLYGESAGLTAGATGMSNGYRFEVDENHLLSYSQPRRGEHSVWLFLGDSVTMGIGVDPDSTFAGRIAGRLDTVRVANPSLIGYAADDYRRVLEGLLDQQAAIGPIERVTIFWCLNDIYGDLPVAAEPGQALRRRGAQLLTWIRQNFMTYQWIKALLFDRPRTYYEHDVQFYAVGSKHLRSSLVTLSAIQSLCSERGIYLEVVLLPYQYQLRDDGQIQPQQTMQRHLERLAIPVHDPASFLKKQAKATSDLYLFGDGIHFSPHGHALLADFLLNQLSMTPPETMK